MKNTLKLTADGFRIDVGYLEGRKSQPRFYLGREQVEALTRKLKIIKLWESQGRGNWTADNLAAAKAIATGKAFYQPQFYEGIGGSVAGVAFGLAGSAAVVAWVPGPGWVVGGTAIVAGAAAGTVGYVGGRAGTQLVLEVLAPNMLQEQQKRQVADVQARIGSEIAATMKWP